MEQPQKFGIMYFNFKACNYYPQNVKGFFSISFEFCRDILCESSRYMYKKFQLIFAQVLLIIIKYFLSSIYCYAYNLSIYILHHV